MNSPAGLTMVSCLCKDSKECVRPLPGSLPASAVASGEMAEAMGNNSEDPFAARPGDPYEIARTCRPSDLCRIHELHRERVDDAGIHSGVVAASA